MRTGQMRDCRQSLNGSALRRITRSKEILSEDEKIFTQPQVSTSGDDRRAAPNVRRRLGVDPQRLLALPRLSRRARCAWRIQRQVHVQPIRFAWRFLRRPRAVIFAELIAISSNQKNAGSLQGSDSHAIHGELVGRDRRTRAERYCHNDRRPANGHTIRFAVPAATSDLLSDVIAGLPPIRARCLASISTMSAVLRCSKRSANCRSITSLEPRSIFWIATAPKSRRNSDRMFS